MSRPLIRRFPVLAARCPVLPLAELPTPVSQHRIRWSGRDTTLAVKHDEASGPLYGGNKVRKLEFLLQRATDQSAQRIATYGATGSNHALATAIYARRAGFDCTCLLSQQVVKPGIAKTLLVHQQLGTELILFAGARKVRVRIQRTMLQGRNIYLIPMGGSCWLGNLGFVNAALELGQQVESGELSCPERLYIPLGTMGTAIGLALGFALANLDIELHAVRVTDERVANRRALQRQLHKTAAVLHQIDPSVPADLATRARIVFRDEFVGNGYGHSNAVTEQAISFAHQYLGIELESTYSGKAMAAMLHDIAARRTHAPLFWNTFNNIELPVAPGATPDFRRVPEAFRRYFDTT